MLSLTHGSQLPTALKHKQVPSVLTFGLLSSVPKIKVRPVSCFHNKSLLAIALLLLTRGLWKAPKDGWAGCWGNDLGLELDSVPTLTALQTPLWLLGGCAHLSTSTHHSAHHRSPVTRPSPELKPEVRILPRLPLHDTFLRHLQYFLWKEISGIINLLLTGSTKGKKITIIRGGTGNRFETPR